MRTIWKRASTLFRFPTARECVRNASCCSHKRIGNPGLKNHEQFYSATLLTSGLKLLFPESLITNSTTVTNIASKQLILYMLNQFFTTDVVESCCFSTTQLKNKSSNYMQLPTFANIITSSRNGIL